LLRGVKDIEAEPSLDLTCKPRASAVKHIGRQVFSV
jgi:hypothetical protein